MNWDRIQSEWGKYKASMRESFAKLTDEDLDKSAGRRDQLLVRLQERYGYSRDVAEQKLTDFAAKMMPPAAAGRERTGARRAEKA